MRLTVAQALVRFLSAQSVERDGERHRFFAGCLGIFGHGNVAGVGQALLEAGDDLPYYLARNEQAMVHTAVGYARMSDRLRAMACTTSIGPGATNLVTGAAVATTNRIPVLLLPGDVFATRRANPVLQELEDPTSLDVSVNDCLRPVSRYFDRVWRPEQLAAALLNAMRVLTDPAETGAVTLAIPQDVATEAFDVPDGLLDERVWRDPPAAGRAGAARRGRRDGALGDATARRGRRRRPLLGREHGARAPRPRDRPAGRRDPGRQGRPALRPPGEPRRARGDRHHGRQRGRARRRPGDRRGHALERLHHRVALGLRRPRRSLRQRQRDPLRHGQARRARRRRRRARRARGPGRPPGRLAGRPGVRVALPRAGGAVERGRRGGLRRAPLAARPGRGDRPRSRRRPRTATSWSARPAACPATCTSSGARATPRGTTSSTPTPAWATRSPPGSA